jgi:hypothetical protein
MARLCLHVIAGLALFVTLVGPYLRALEFFERRETPLPAVTLSIHTVAMWWNGYWFIGIPLALLVDVVMLGSLEVLPQRFRWLASAWFSLVLVAIILFQALAMAAIAVPLSYMDPVPPEAGADVE